MSHAPSSELLHPAGEFDLACGCADERCTFVVQLEPEELEIIRSDPRLFVVAPGHDHGCGGDVLVRADRYVVVRASRHGDLQLVAMRAPARRGNPSS